MSKQINFFPTGLSLNHGIKECEYQFRVENAEFTIPNLRYIALFSQSIVFKTGGL